VKTKQLVGGVIIAVGVVCLCLSYYIKQQVAQGLSKAEGVSQGLSTFGQGGKIVGGIVEKHASGKASPYQQNAQFLLMGGIALLVIGGTLVVFCNKK